MYRDLTKGNLITIIISLIAAIVSFGCVVYLIPQITNTQMQLFFTTVISTIGAAFLVNFLWEIFAKKRFAESVLEMAKISKNIEQSGVDHIDIDYIMDNVALMAFFKHSPGKSTVPYIRAESSGSFYNYIIAEKRAILNDSVSVSVITDVQGNKITVDGRHTALGDAKATMKMYEKMLQLLHKK